MYRATQLGSLSKLCTSWVAGLNAYEGNLTLNHHDHRRCTQTYHLMTAMTTPHIVSGLFNVWMLAHLPTLVLARTFTVTNSCPFTIWCVLLICCTDRHL